MDFSRQESLLILEGKCLESVLLMYLSSSCVWIYMKEKACPFFGTVGACMDTLEITSKSDYKLMNGGWVH